MKIEIVAESMLGIKGQNMPPGVHEIAEPLSKETQTSIEAFMAKGLIKVVEEPKKVEPKKVEPKKVEEKAEPKKVEEKAEPKKEAPKKVEEKVEPKKVEEKANYKTKKQNKKG